MCCDALQMMFPADCLWTPSVNVVIAGVFIFLLKPFSYLIEYILLAKADILPIWPEFLDEKCLPRADDALECVRKELQRELVLAQGMFSKTMDLAGKFNEGIRRMSSMLSCGQ